MHVISANGSAGAGRRQELAPCSVAKDYGASLVIVNAEPTGFDTIADAVVRGSISDVLPALVGR